MTVEIETVDSDETDQVLRAASQGVLLFLQQRFECSSISCATMLLQYLVEELGYFGEDVVREYLTALADCYTRDAAAYEAANGRRRAAAEKLYERFEIEIEKGQSGGLH